MRDEATVVLADKWFAEGPNLPAADRARAMQHAADLYQAAVKGLTGLEKLAVEKKLSQISRSRGPHRVNLLRLFDPAGGLCKGDWHMQDGVLVADAAAVGRVGFPYQPPAEYDFQIGFTISHPDPDAVAQICYCNGHQFTFVIGAFANTVTGFGNINGKGERDNETCEKKPRWLALDRHYTSLVKVRKTGVEAFLDGHPITSYKTDYSDITMNDGWSLPRQDIVGIGAYRNAVHFDSAEIVEVTGKGKTPTP